MRGYYEYKKIIQQQKAVFKLKCTKSDVGDMFGQKQEYAEKAVHWLGQGRMPDTGSIFLSGLL